ncbi:MAG: hypothetical protein AAGN35_26130 [Bacteroidota bacterium]
MTCEKPNVPAYLHWDGETILARNMIRRDDGLPGQAERQSTQVAQYPDCLEL